MTKHLTIVVTVAAFLGIGLWNALSSGSGNAEPGNVVQTRLTGLPMTIGKWQGQDSAVTEKVLKTARAEAYLSRTYSLPGGDAVNLMVLYGEPGELGLHDPKVCYGMKGFEMAGGYNKRNVPGDEPCEFWSARFNKPSPDPASFEVVWAWGTGKNWQAPDEPRLAFAGESRIYKLYFQYTLRDTPSPTTLDIFLPPFLDELRKVLTAPQ